MTHQNQGISLSFSRKIENKKLQNSALKGLDALPTCALSTTGLKHSISSFDKDAQLPDTSKKEEIIIPLVQTNRDAVFNNLQKKLQKIETPSSPSMTEMTLDEKAAAAIIKESSEEFISNLKSKSELSIDQTSYANASSDLFENTGSISTLEEYDQVNVEHFGAALLRGMGWNHGKGIGKNNKRVINIIDPTTKTFVLTNVEKEKDIIKPDEEETLEDEELKKGTMVLIHSGRNRGTYGIIETVDEDHILVRAARGDKVLREVEHNVKVVSAKEYKELSRVINKEMYDEYKAAENIKKERKKDAKSDEKNSKRRNKANERESETATYRNDLDISDKLAEKERKGRGHKDRGDSYEERGSKGNSEYNKERGASDNSGYKREKDEGLSDSSRCKKIKEKDSNIDNDRYREKERVSSGNGGHHREKLLHDSSKSRSETERFSSDKVGYKNYENKSRKEANKYLSKEPTENERIGLAKYTDDLRHKKVKLKNIDDGFVESDKQSHLPVIPWARENLRVRIIDKEYKGGKYHKEKVVVCSVETINNCTCRTSDGKILYDVNPDNLETVIPKGQSALIFIVKGKYKGEKGRILELDRAKEKAVIQLLGESSVILKLYYEDICEYVR